MSRKVTVAMPAYNEEEGIAAFLDELARSLQTWEPMFVVLDDCSTDQTFAVVCRLKGSGFPVAVFRNELNVGHGPSTLRALTLAVESGADVVVAIDGDGQFRGEDVAALLEQVLLEESWIGEGVRQSRAEPLYRRCVSWCTRALVWSRCGEWPLDANTPLRVYQRAHLVKLLEIVPECAATPNLRISVLSRQAKWRRSERPVTSLPRRGQSQQGSTWGTAHKNLPTRRFIRFCIGAFVEWIPRPRGKDSDQLGEGS